MMYTLMQRSVSPKLKLGKSVETTLYGRVATKFANPQYVASKCQTPIQMNADPIAGTTCLSIEHAGQGFVALICQCPTAVLTCERRYHNYQQYLATWTELVANGSSFTDLLLRPAPVALLHDNTTVQGSWVNVQNMTEVSARYGQRIVNNISMAMPHVGIFTAARDPLNGIMQPETIDVRPTHPAVSFEDDKLLTSIIGPR